MLACLNGGAIATDRPNQPTAQVALDERLMYAWRKPTLSKLLQVVDHFLKFRRQDTDLVPQFG